MLTEYGLWAMARAEGFQLAYVVRASHEEWDRYESGNWQGLLRWLRENPEHGDRAEVLDHLNRSQDDYFRFGRAYSGWAIYLPEAALGRRPQGLSAWWGEV